LEINPDDRPPLPRSLAEALVRLEGTAAARTWLGAELLAGYLAYKRRTRRAPEPAGKRDLSPLRRGLLTVAPPLP